MARSGPKGTRKNLEEVELSALRHLAAIVESSDNAIISKTLDGLITSCDYDHLARSLEEACR